MSEKELQQIEYALSLVSDPVFSAVMQQYIDSNGIEQDITRENCTKILESIYEAQVAEEEIGFDYFYDVLTTFIQDSLAELLSIEE
mgnify:CR=1 FL=1